MQIAISREIGLPLSDVRAMSEADFRDYCEHMARETSAADRIDRWGARIVSILLAVHGEQGKAPTIEELLPDPWAIPESKETRREKFRSMLRMAAQMCGKGG
jgi:hypothetical protein